MNNLILDLLLTVFYAVILLTLLLVLFFLLIFILSYDHNCHCELVDQTVILPYIED